MLNDYFHIQLHSSRGVVLPLSSTAEVISLPQKDICPIPGVAPALLGVVNQRGRLLWVLELSHLLKLAQPTIRVRQAHLLLVVLTSRSTDSATEAERQVGCVVSALKGIVQLNPSEFRHVPAKLDSSISSLLSGVAEVEQSPVAVLNVNAVFAALHTPVPTNSLMPL